MGHLCHVWGLSHLWAASEGQGAGVVCATVSGGMNPATTAAWFPVGMGAALAGRLELHAPPFLLLLGSLGLRAQLPQPGDGITGTTSPVPPFPPPLCVPAPIPLQIHRRVDLSGVLVF